MLGKSGVINHPHFVTARESLFELAFSEFEQDGSIALLAGASRSGKTHLLNELQSAITQRLNPDTWVPPNGIAHSTPIPFIRHEAITSSRMSYSLDTLWRQLIKCLCPEAVIGSGDLRMADTLSALASIIENRGTRWIIIDEAHHLLYFRPGRSSKDDHERMYQQMEEIKNLVNMTGIKIVLAGSPKLLEAWSLSEQFGGRSRTVPLYLYNPVSNDDIKEFVRQSRALVNDAFNATYNLNDKFYLRLFRAYAGSIGTLSKFVAKISTSTDPDIDRLLQAPNVMSPEIIKNIMASDRELREHMKSDEEHELSMFLSANLDLSRKETLSEDTPPKDSKVTSLSSSRKRRVGKKNDKRLSNLPEGFTSPMK